MAFTHYRTKGVFLRAEARGEADEIFTLFTQEFGKIKVLGRAIRKITSKLRKGAGVFYFSEIEFIQGKQYKTLTDAILIDKFNITPEIAEVIDCLVPTAQCDDKIWNLLVNVLKLEIKNSLEIKNLKLKIISNNFLWKLFDILGYGPELYNCAKCGKKLLPEKLFFVPIEGGVVCVECFQKSNSESVLGCDISANTVKLLRIFLKEPLDIIDKITISKSGQESLQKIADFYLNYLKESSYPQRAFDK